MLNIHLCNDEKFINTAREKFESHFPDRNTFIINKVNNKDLKYVELSNNTVLFDFESEEIQQYILSVSEGVKEVNIFIHFLDIYKARLINQLRNKLNFKNYWIFYGADLYNLLHKKGRYELFDRKSSGFVLNIQHLLRGWYFYIRDFRNDNELKEFISELNYFCFWNYYDYKLLKDNFKTNAEFRKFIYGSTHDFTSYFEGFKSETKVILVNNSGSASGNHLTILKKLNKEKIKASFSTLIVPLNYGSKNVITEVDAFCVENFNTHYKPLLEFMEKGSYFNLIKEVDVVFFGHLRQEGAGNIILLLSLGAKVFLREQNNMMKYYRDLGLKLFSWEKDFVSEDDLKPLTIAHQKRNREIILKEFSTKNFENIYSKLLIKE